MIIIKYLFGELFKSQLAILFILLLIFLCQKLIRILGGIIDGNIPINLIFALLELGLPEIIKLILPLSLFLAILLTFGKFYNSNEIIAMNSCGFSNIVLVKSTMILVILTSMIAIVNVIWLAPWSACYQEKIIKNAIINPISLSVINGNFQTFSDGNTVLFIEKVKGNKFGKIFLAQLEFKKNVHPSVILADNGYIQQNLNGSQIIILDKGTRFEGIATLGNFNITHFINYQARINYKKINLNFDNPEQLSLGVLFKNKKMQFKAELYWRLTLVLSVLIMGIMVIPLSLNDFFYDRTFSMLPSMFLYLIFFLLETSFKSNAEKGDANSLNWMLAINLFYFILAIILNLWQIGIIRRLRAYFSFKKVF
ncbi:LPS export ABC transporter permease LptF [Pantoea sp. Mhis]|uniref:LPS export ABC transporter permease LptF n=1 Tax=Pantoea sp. Mhis TaxID=2576759 RepID=UPI0013574A11|nr:LPS export ABC transporter permease LptF [Pantoea sp. Mhis]MXP56459.1 LPS export ABC transporter permease LptF [Pantoea sp. Mhis]